MKNNTVKGPETKPSNVNYEKKECPISLSFKEVEGIRNLEIKDKNNNHVSDINPPFFSLTGTQNKDLAREIIGHGAVATHAFGNSEEGMENKWNLSMQSLAEAQPQDVVEARLATQSNALYSRGMHCLAHLEGCKDLAWASFWLNSATKLLRLHNETIECLSRYRRKGESKVVVQHVTINDNGKAIVAGTLSGPGYDQNYSR